MVKQKSTHGQKSSKQTPIKSKSYEDMKNSKSSHSVQSKIQQSTSTTSTTTTTSSSSNSTMLSKVKRAATENVPFASPFHFKRWSMPYELAAALSPPKQDHQATTDVKHSRRMSVSLSSKVFASQFDLTAQGTCDITTIQPASRIVHESEIRTTRS